jgi:hypothetical protein
MSEGAGPLKVLIAIAFLLTLLTPLGAKAGLLGFGGDSWQEEVLLHNGSKIIVKRSQSYGGRHEIGQGGSISEQDIAFTVPGTNQSIIWNNAYSEDLGRANFVLMALF